MKKLMTMIAAVATAFGLFADEPTTYNGTSFEVAEEGVSELKWTPASGVPAGTWSTTPKIEDALDLGAYTIDDPAYGYASGEGATNTRRDGQFAGGSANANYLKLDTGSATVDRAVADGQVFFDQVIKFTGFEDMQTNFVAGTKIALWTSAIEPEEAEGEEDTEGYVPAVPADTNLYVAVGDGLGAIKNLKIDVDDDFDFNAWHRVTIKNASKVCGNYLGFFIWIDGVMAQTANKEYFDGTVTEFKSYYDKGQLFISMDGTSETATTVANIGFQGVGSLDDVVVDKDGPAFAVLTVDVTFAPIAGAVIAEVKDADGVVEGKDGTYSVKPGNITVTLAPAAGYKMKGDGVYMVDASAAGQKTIPVQDGDFIEGYATLNGEIKGEAELAGMMASLVDKDVVEFIKNCDVTNGEEEVLYTVKSNTSITVDGIAWNIFVGNYIDGNEVTAGTFKDNVGVAANAKKAFTFEDTTAGKLTLTVNVNGTLEATNGTTAIAKNITLGEAATLKAADLSLGSAIKSYTITLSGAAKVMTTVNTFTDAQIIPSEGELDISGSDEDGYYTYQIKQAPTETGFAIIITDATPAVTNYFDTLEEAIAAAGTVVEDVQLPNVVTIMADNLGDGTRVTIEKEVTLDLNSFTLNRRIASLHDGKVTVKNGTLTSAEASTIYVDFGGAVTLADNAKVVNTYEAASNNGIAIAAYAGCTVTVGAGCEVSSKHYGIVVNNDEAAYDRDTTLTVNGKVTAEDAFAICGNGNDTNGTDITIGATAEVESQNDIGIYFPNDGTLAINGGTVKGATAVYVKAGATTILTDANLIATGDKADYTPYTNGANATGDALVIDNCGYPAGTLSIAVNGGKFTSANAAAASSYADTSKSLAPITGFISGGLFKGVDETDAALLAAKDGKNVAWADAEEGYKTPSYTDWLKYYADMFTNNVAIADKAAPGTGSHQYPFGAVVPCENAGVLKDVAFPSGTKLDGTFYVSKLTAGASTWQFEYNAETDKVALKADQPEGVTVDENGVIHYTFTAGQNAKIGEIYLTKYEPPAPAKPVSKDADIGDVNPSSGAYPVTPKAGATEVDISNGSDFPGAFFEIPSSVTKIKGIEATQIRIMNTAANYNITEALKFSGDATNGITYELDPAAVVHKGDALETPVTPTIQAIDTEFDIAGGTMEVKGIAGLYYTLVGADEVTAMADAAKIVSVQATETGAPVKLVDPTEVKPAAQFYQVKVTIDEIK